MRMSCCTKDCLWGSSSPMGPFVEPGTTPPKEGDESDLFA